MRRIISFIVVLCVGLSLFACSDKKIEFKDPVLSKMISEALDKPEGSITVKDAAAITELDLQIQWQAHIPEEQQIKDISGLEHFVNLTNLNLSFHAIEDITAIGKLSKLTALSLGGNRIKNIAPLSGLTQLNRLELFNCEAEDYTALSNLVNLEHLSLGRSLIKDISVLSGLNQLRELTIDNTEVSDISSLANLVKLERLHLSNTPIIDFTPLETIYDQLSDKDFIYVKSLEELGFQMDTNNPNAVFYKDNIAIMINHQEWGVPAMDLEVNCVQTHLTYPENQRLVVIYYPLTKYFVFAFYQQDEVILNYIYDITNDTLNISNEEQETAKELYRNILNELADKKGALAPIPVFEDAIYETFGIGEDALFNLPFSK